MGNITIGIPRGMLFYRFKYLWHAFFKVLNVDLKYSPVTDQGILNRGSALAVDEMCLSGKIYLGHVDALVGKCDYILIPRVSNFGFKRMMCTRFESFPDIVKNVYMDSSQEFLTYNLDVNSKKDEKQALIELGLELGFDKKIVKEAYSKAKRFEAKRLNERLLANERLYKKDGLKILICAHDYVLEDPYLGRPVSDILKSLGVIPIFAGIVDSKAAVKKALTISPTLKWQYNLELTGSLAMNINRVDGIVFLSAFPCGPDSMVNEILMRRFKEKPMVNLTLDGQSGTAGLETRLESFIDIIHFKEGTL